MSPGFDVNDIGFMSRADVINYHVGGGWKWTKPTKHRKYQDWIARDLPELGLRRQQHQRGDLDAGARPSSRTTTAGTTASPTTRRRRARAARAAARARPTCPATRSAPTSTPTASRSCSTSSTRAPTSSPRRTRRTGTSTPASSSSRRRTSRCASARATRTSSSTRSTSTTIDNPANTDTYGADYVFATLHQQQISANIRLNWAFTPALSLQFFGQPLIAIGEYSDYKALAKPNSYDFSPTRSRTARDNFNVTSLIGNAVLRYEYRPGSAFYLVWSQNRYDDAAVGNDFDFASSRQRMWTMDADNVFLAKFTYYFNL